MWTAASSGVESASNRCSGMLWLAGRMRAPPPPCAIANESAAWLLSQYSPASAATFARTRINSASVRPRLQARFNTSFEEHFSLRENSTSALHGHEASIETGANRYAVHGCFKKRKSLILHAAHATQMPPVGVERIARATGAHALHIHRPRRLSVFIRRQIRVPYKQHKL